MTITDAQILTAFTAGLGVIATLAKMWANKMQSHIEALDRHTAECNEDRAKLRARQDQHIAETAELRTIINAMSSCDLRDCPRRDLLKMTSRHAIHTTKTK